MERDGWEEEEEREHINNIGDEGKREGVGWVNFLSSPFSMSTHLSFASLFPPQPIRLCFLF